METSYKTKIVREHVYSRRHFVKKASHLASWVQGIYKNTETTRKTLQPAKRRFTEYLKNDVKRAANVFESFEAWGFCPRKKANEA